MDRPVHLVMVEEDNNMLLRLVEACELLGYRCSIVPGKIIQHGRVGGYIASEVKSPDAAIVASFYADSRMPKGEDVVASIRAHCPNLLIIGCGGDDSHAQAMRKAGAKGFALRGMRTGVAVLFSLIQKLLEQTAASSSAKATPDQT